MVQKLGHEFGKHLAILQSVAVLREGGRIPDRVVGRKPHTSGTRDCNPTAPSAGVPTGSRRTPEATTRSAIVPVESRDGLRSRRASPGYGSAPPAHRAQAPGSS